MGRSPLHGLHEELGARFVDFGGWEMPVQYSSVLAEHRAVREGVGWFDVSHLGRFRVGNRRVVDRLLTNNLDLIEPGRTQYTLLLNEAAGIEDDLLVWWWQPDSLWVLPNAATHERVLALFASENGTCEDLRNETVMLAVQGPNAPALLESILGVSPKRFRTYELTFDGKPMWLAGTGYTGERGGEVVSDAQTAAKFAKALRDGGAVPCGLAARDTLRLEAGLLLAGQDFGPTVDPRQAGLEWAVNNDHEFVGKDSWVALQSEEPSRRLAAFRLPGRRIPRPGYRLRAGESEGTVTSGNFSPTLEDGIGLGYLAPPSGEDPEVEIRGMWERAQAVELPFLRR
jgi:aminomethyltransferase